MLMFLTDSLVIGILTTVGRRIYHAYAFNKQKTQIFVMNMTIIPSCEVKK